MEILISDSRTLKEIQQEFSREFPYLKLEFFDVPYNANKPAHRSKMFPNDRKLSSCRKVHNEGVVSIRKEETVADLENDLWRNFGLSVQVFRQSGSLWIETSLTDAWTLDRQNKEGLEMSATHTNPYKEAEETDLTDRDKWE